MVQKRYWRAPTTSWPAKMLCVTGWWVIAARAFAAGDDCLFGVTVGCELKYTARMTIPMRMTATAPMIRKAESSVLDFLGVISGNVVGGAVIGGAVTGLAQNEQNADSSRMLLPQWGQNTVGDVYHFGG